MLRAFFPRKIQQLIRRSGVNKYNYSTFSTRAFDQIQETMVYIIKYIDQIHVRAKCHLWLSYWIIAKYDQMQLHNALHRDSKCPFQFSCIMELLSALVIRNIVKISINFYGNGTN